MLKIPPIQFDVDNRNVQDLIYVSLEAESIRQMIKLSQELISPDDIEAEIERTAEQATISPN